MAEAAISRGTQNGGNGGSAALAASHTDTNANAPKLNVLIVENEAYTRTLIREVVRTMGAEQISVANDAKTALSQLEDKPAVNLIVCDLRLPDMTGLELLAKLRRRTPKVAFMLLSDHAEPAHIQMAVESGVDAIVVKPFSRAQLDTKLRFLARRIGEPKPAAH